MGNYKNQTAGNNNTYVMLSEVETSPLNCHPERSRGISFFHLRFFDYAQNDRVSIPQTSMITIWINKQKFTSQATWD